MNTIVNSKEIKTRVTSTIKTLDADGLFNSVKTYTLPPEIALVCYLEQYINKNFNTWEYYKSEFQYDIKRFKDHRGYMYYNEKTQTHICAYITKEE